MRNFSNGLFLVALMLSPHLVEAANPPSASGTAIPSSTQIVDGQGNTWTVSGGQAYENGTVTPSSEVILLLYDSGVVYQENAHNDWWRWGGNGAWIASSDPRGVSASSTTIPSSTQIVDSQLNIWTLAGGLAYENGQSTPSNSVIVLLYANGIVYQENIHDNWWQWSSGAWVATSAPVVASSSGTTVPSATQIVDSQLNAWTLSGGQAYENGNLTPSSGVILLLFYNGSVYQENIHDNWWQWSSGSWVATSSDPRVPALAAAAGYNTLTFNSTLFGTTSGTWQTSNLNGIPGCAGAVVQNDDGSFTISSANSGGCSVVTAIKNSSGADDWTGVTFEPGMYIKVVMAYTGINVGESQTNPAWPSFWGEGILHADGGTNPNGSVLDQWPGQASNYEHFLEADFWEAFCGTAGTGPCSGVNSTGTNTGLTTLIDWYGVYDQTCSGQAYCNIPKYITWDLPNNETWAAQHTLEFVYVPATSSTNGHLVTYVDGTQYSFTYTWDQYNAGLAPPPVLGSSAFSIGDVQNFALVVKTGQGTPLTVYSVQVWQASTAGMLQQ